MEPVVTIDARFFSEIWMLPDGSRHEIVPLERAQRWFDELRKARKDSARLNWLEREMEREHDTSGYDSLFRRNVPITREAIDAVMREILPGDRDPFDCQAFHELCMDYRGAPAPRHAQVAYERLQAYCREQVSQALERERLL